MTPDQRFELRLLALMGLCLLYIQRAERVIAYVLEKVIRDPSLTIAALSRDAESARPQTLGPLLKELRKHARIESGFNKKLFRFLRMRNTFVHDFSEGWDLHKKEGQQAALDFIIDLLSLAFAVIGVFTSLVAISARVEFGEELDEGNRLLAKLEELYGTTAHQIFKGMNRKPRTKARRAD